MTEDNQSVFTMKENIDIHRFRVAYNVKQTNCRREIDFNLSQNDENSIDSSFDSLQIRISVKRFLQNITVTINNQFSKKRKKRFKSTKRKSRFNLFSRIDFNVLSYIFRRFDFVVIFLRNVKRASKRIVERVKRTIKQKQKIEQSNQKNEVD